MDASQEYWNPRSNFYNVGGTFGCFSRGIMDSHSLWLRHGYRDRRMESRMASW